MIQAARTFGHYPLAPNFIKTYSQQNYMAAYLHA